MSSIGIVSEYFGLLCGFRMNTFFVIKLDAEMRRFLITVTGLMENLEKNFWGNHSNGRVLNRSIFYWRKGSWSENPNSTVQISLNWIFSTFSLVFKSANLELIFPANRKHYLSKNYTFSYQNSLSLLFV